MDKGRMALGLPTSGTTTAAGAAGAGNEFAADTDISKIKIDPSIEKKPLSILAPEKITQDATVTTFEPEQINAKISDDLKIDMRTPEQKLLAQKGNLAEQSDEFVLKTDVTAQATDIGSKVASMSDEDFKTLGNKIRLLQINKNDSKQKLNLKEEALKNIKNLETNKINISEYRNNLKNLVEELDTVDFNINYPSTQLTLFNRNMMGKKLTGVFANQTTNHAKSQYTELQLVSPVLFNDKKYKMLNQQNNSEGNRISKSLASLLAAVVDNAKDPISSNLNLNTFTADLASMLLRAGVNQDTVFSFINQPAIVELTKKHFLTKGALS